MKNFFGKTGLVSLLMAVAFGLCNTQALAKPPKHGDEAKTAYVVGTVASINASGGSFTVANKKGEKTNVEVSPRTKFKLKSTDPRYKGKKYDTDVQFSDLKVNDAVEAKIYETQNAGWQTKHVHIFVEDTTPRVVNPTRKPASR